mmetsp:Transcript_33716/g.48919  ORF Transcript_33716/g.48919 Transcript_33716/m.48919 type:complete len:212 (+) Transcript_33716:481-1116(+)
MINNGAVPAAGTAAKIGPKNADIPNNTPHTKVERPVFAPALIPAAVSGEMRIGGPEKYPLNKEVSPHTIKSILPRGMAPLLFVSLPKSDMERATPFRKMKYKKNKLNIISTTSGWMYPSSLITSGANTNPSGTSPVAAHHTIVPKINPPQKAPLTWKCNMTATMTSEHMAITTSRVNSPMSRMVYLPCTTMWISVAPANAVIRPTPTEVAA